MVTIPWDKNPVNAEPYNTVLHLAGKLEGLPHRPGPHPSAYTFDPYGPGVLQWLPAQWVGSDRWSRQRFGTARHLAIVAEEQGTPSDLAHLAAKPANEQAPAWSEGQMQTVKRYLSLPWQVDQPWPASGTSLVVVRFARKHSTHAS
jgi:hypothetical protein